MKGTACVANRDPARARTEEGCVIGRLLRGGLKKPPSSTLPRPPEGREPLNTLSSLECGHPAAKPNRGRFGKYQEDPTATREHAVCENGDQIRRRRESASEVRAGNPHEPPSSTATAAATQAGFRSGSGSADARGELARQLAMLLGKARPYAALPGSRRRLRVPSPPAPLPGKHAKSAGEGARRGGAKQDLRNGVGLSPGRPGSEPT
jgi:hypothetical protein